MRVYPRSLRVQLCAWYVLLTMICMGALGVFSYLYLRHALASSRQQTMQKREDRLLRYVREEPRIGTPTPLPESLRRFSLASPDADLLQLYSVRGQRIYPELAPSPSIAWPDSPCLTPCFRVLRLDGHSYRVLQHTVRLHGDDVRLSMAGVIDEHYDILRMVRNSYLIGFPLMLLASIVGGLALAHRALLPVDRMTRAAHTISIHDLRRRLPVPATGDEIQHLAETWNEVLARLEQAVDHLTQFTSDLSHDLRTTITVMLATAELALRRQRTEEEYSEALRTVVLECQRTTALLDDLLALARTEMSQQEIAMEPVNFSEIVREACDHVRPRTELKRQSLHVKISSDAAVLGESSLLRRLVMILLDNAIKYTPDHGVISVCLEVELESVRLDVRDNGIGIAPAEAERIFDRFYRVETSRNRDEGGTGLGLAIAKWISETHGAQLKLALGPSGGSTFSVDLPPLHETHYPQDDRLRFAKGVGN